MTPYHRLLTMCTVRCWIPESKDLKTICERIHIEIIFKFMAWPQAHHIPYYGVSIPMLRLLIGWLWHNNQTYLVGMRFIKFWRHDLHSSSSPGGLCDILSDYFWSNVNKSVISWNLEQMLLNWLHICQISLWQKCSFSSISVLQIKPYNISALLYVQRSFDETRWQC